MSAELLPGLTLASAFLVGLLGGTHCFGMCGGIAGALALGTPGRAPGQPAPLYLLAGMSLGRITSYTLAGTIAGALGATLGLLHLEPLLRGLAAVLLILIGLYLLGVQQGLAWLERGGAGIWRRLQPLTARVLPIDRPTRAFAAGMIWGWLPCGLVYSMLVWAMAQGSALTGGLLLAAFGLGTLPAVVLAGALAGQLRHWMQHRGVRATAGLLVLAFGCWSLWAGLHGTHGAHAPAGHEHHAGTVAIPLQSTMVSLSTMPERAGPCCSTSSTSSR